MAGAVRRRRLKRAHARVKARVAEREVALEEGAVGKHVGSPPVRRQQWPAVRQRGWSCRRACSLRSGSRSLVGYESRRPLRDDAPLATMQRRARPHPRSGERRIRALSQRQGVPVHQQRVDHLWSRRGLSLPRRRQRQRGGPPAPRPPEAARPHERWAYDFVHDRWASGDALTGLVVGAEDTHRCLAMAVGGRSAPEQVIASLARRLAVYGVPRARRSDHGPECVAQAGKAWRSASGMGTA
jgi:putative transposase